MAIAPLNLHSKGGAADRSFRTVALLAGGLVLLILALIAFTTANRAWPAFRLMGLDWFTESRWAPNDDVFGALGFIVGTLISATIAIVLAVPVSLGIALFVTQVAPTWLRRPVIYLMDLLAVVPSVVFGLWGLKVLAPKLVGFYNDLHGWFGSVPVLGDIFGPPSQRGTAFFTAGIILAIMITPIVTSLAREVIDTTPAGEKEGALALGATRWEMIRGAVLPHSKGGLVGAVMLGLGRAMGETIAVTLVIGGSVGVVTANVLASGNSMPATIASQWGEATGNFRAALLGLAVTLFVLTILINLAANAVVARSMRKSRGA